MHFVGAFSGEASSQPYIRLRVARFDAISRHRVAGVDDEEGVVGDQLVIDILMRGGDEDGVGVGQ